MIELKGKVALVTGASRGIGAEIAYALALAGAFVYVNYRKNSDAAKETVEKIFAAGGKAQAKACDVTDSRQVEEMVADIVCEAGGVDIVVNNALVDYSFDPDNRKTFEQIDWTDFERQFRGSVGGAFHICRAVLPEMKKQNAGRIINITTNLTELPLVPYHDYTTAKSGLLGFSRNLAKEAGRYGVTVNCVSPGLTYPTAASRATKFEVREQVAQMTALGRIARPEDVVGPVLFFASDLSQFVTGQCLHVDGGLVMS